MSNEARVFPPLSSPEARVYPPRRVAGVSLAAQELLATEGTVYDPSGIGVSIAANGNNIDVTIDTPATVSDLPHLGYGRHYPLVDVLGAAKTGDGVDGRWPVIFGPTPPAPADISIICGFYNDAVSPGGAPQSSSIGFAAKLAYDAGDWNCRALRSAGSWLQRTPVNSNPNTEGAIAHSINRATNTSHTVSAQPLDGAGLAIANANEATVDDLSNIGDGLNRVFWCVGWDTGSGGASSQLVTIHAGAALLKVMELAGILP